MSATDEPVPCDEPATCPACPTPNLPPAPAAPAAPDPDYLHDMWTFYFHDPEDLNWNLDSYKRLGDVSTVQDFWAIHEAIRPFLSDGMFFVMRGDVYPCWDDPGNIQGGCLSIKVPRDKLEGTWLHVLTHLLGEGMLDLPRIRDSADLCSLLRDQDVDLDSVLNGVSVSPKRFFSIIKLWLRTNHLTTRQWFRLPAAYDGEVLYKANADNIKDSHRQQHHNQQQHAAAASATILKPDDQPKSPITATASPIQIQTPASPPSSSA